MTGHHNILQSDVVSSGAISNGYGASIEDLVSFRNRERSRPWSDYSGSFDR